MAAARLRMERNNMFRPNKETIEEMRRVYEPGTRVTLLKMDDPQAPPVGTKGTVTGVDDIGSILVSWDNGSNLHVVYGEDEVALAPGFVIPAEVRSQILAVRDTGLTNMFDVEAVQQIAYDHGFDEAVEWIENNRKTYCNFIMYGD